MTLLLPGPYDIEFNSTTPSTAEVSIQWKDIDKKSLDSILTNKEGFEMASKLKGGDAAAIVDLLVKIVDSEDLTDLQRKRHLALLRRLCGNNCILPTSCIITGNLVKVGELPVAGSGFAEIWEGRLEGRKVAIKVLRLYTIEDPLRLKKRVCKEAFIWKKLSHPNLLPFIGVVHTSSQFWLVSPWMDLGNTNEYLKAYPKADRTRLLRDVADGLSYLHSKDIVHGNVKGDNILISENHEAKLADFGLTTITSDMLQDHPLNSFGNGTLRWMAPELFAPNNFCLEKSIPSKESDIYALGMVIYEVLSGAIPFARFRQTEVVSKVIEGLRPDQPTDPTIRGLVNDMWPLAEECWQQKPSARPTISNVLERLSSFVK